MRTCTWDQAEIMGWYSAQSFKAVGIEAATIRQWASRGFIRPVAVGPRGAKLYAYDEVVRHADSRRSAA